MKKDTAFDNVLDHELFRWSVDSPFPKWTLADESLMAELLGTKRFQLGPRGALLYKLFNIAARFRLESAVLLLVTLVSGLHFGIRAARSKRNDISFEGPFRVLAGFGAGQVEDDMYAEFASESSCPAFHVVYAKPKSVGALFAPSLLRVIKSVFETIPGLVKTAKTAPEFSPEQMLWYFTSVGMRSGAFCYMTEWWKKARDAGLTECRYVTADASAFACLEVGVTTDYYAHGLISKYIVFPVFRKIVLKTKDEVNFVERFNSESVISVHPKAILQPVHLGSTILIASTCSLQALPFCQKSVSNIRVLVEWAQQRNLKIVVRLHRREDGSFWKENIPNLEIDQRSWPFDEIIGSIKPVFVVSWFSTALFDALQHGILPVLISEAAVEIENELVYPLRKRCLNWPVDAGIMSDVLGSKALYLDRLSKLKQDNTLKN